jgi:nitrogen fixation/metabolism regulation signal transduction histidine kinase
MIKTKINHLIETIDEFRKFFRHDTPKELANIESIIDSVISLEKEAIDRSNISIITESNGNAEYSLIVAEFKHVFINMFSNSLYAFDETASQEKIIKITIDNKPNQIEIRWLDSAGGIPNEFLEQVFLANKTTKGSKGTGVGLYLSTQIIEKIGGKLSVENVEWKYNGNSYKGALFLIVLPK